MAAKKQTRGECAFCGKETAKGWMTRHVKSCEARAAAIQKADGKKGKAQNIYHLQIEDAYLKDFWLHLEMNGNATMADLDAYLRAIWLECCGHLSEFSFEAWNEEAVVDMETRADKVFAVGTELLHLYDFGTTSETVIKVIDERKGQPLSKHPIFLMSRNQMPETTCLECGRKAEWLCMECLIEEGKMGVFCGEHIEEHPHDEYGDPVELVNSPRVGMCGYDGPAEPPY